MRSRFLSSLIPFAHSRCNSLTSTLAEINITTRKAKETVEEMNPEDSVKKSKKYLEKQGLA